MKSLSEIISPQPGQVISKRELAQSLCEKMKERYRDNRFRVINPAQPDDISIEITGPDQHKFSCYVDNLYTVYLESPQRLDEFYENMLTTMDSLLMQADNAKPVLLPAIKNMSWIEAVQHAPKDGKDSAFLQTTYEESGKKLAQVSLIDDLCVVFTLDTPHHMSYVFQEQVQNFSDSGNIQNIYEQALENLRKNLFKMKVRASPLGYTIRLDSNYDVSLILLYDEWKERIALWGGPNCCQGHPHHCRQPQA